MTDSKGKIVSESNYTVSYAKGCKNVGRYDVKINFKGDYSGRITKTFEIRPKGMRVSKATAAKKGFSVKWKKLHKDSYL